MRNVVWCVFVFVVCGDRTLVVCAFANTHIAARIKRAKMRTQIYKKETSERMHNPQSCHLNYNTYSNTCGESDF